MPTGRVLKRRVSRLAHSIQQCADTFCGFLLRLAWTRSFKSDWRAVLNGVIGVGDVCCAKDTGSEALEAAGRDSDTCFGRLLSEHACLDRRHQVVINLCSPDDI